MSIDFLESVSMAVRTLSANKMRSSLTMLGIIIGNASVIAMVSVGQGARRFSISNFSPWEQICCSWCPVEKGPQTGRVQ